MARALTYLRQGADFVAASMLAALFATFVVQIAARYVFNFSVGWTVEVCLTLWLWLVLWGAAFCLSDRDHVKFDLLYVSARPAVRRVFAAVSALAIVVALILALPASWDYVDFYKIKRSATLRIPQKWVFIIYIAFCLALILRYAWAFMDILRGRPLSERDIT
jgi:C4-dicarboxylate transporter, DctQ subunit